MPHSVLLNDHNVYILGAGFSVDAGLPLIRDFLEGMRDSIGWLKEQGRTAEVEAIDRVLVFRQEAAAAAYRTTLDVENVEELFSLASAEDATSRLRDMTLAIAATLDFCRTLGKAQPNLHTEVVFDHHLPTTPLGQLPWKPLAGQEPGFAANAKIFRRPVHDWYAAAMLGLLGPERADARNTFVTFNYDLVLEEALRTCGWSIDYGIPRTGLTTSAKWVQLGDVNAMKTATVLKLHGSVNWAFPGRRGNKMTAFDSYADVRAAELAPVLVPPTWRKEFKGQLVAVWNSALAALASATRVVIVGFSMPPTDLHFRYLISAGLTRNISLRQFIFVDPHVDEVVRPRALGVLRPELVERGTLYFVREVALTFLLGGPTLGFIGRPFTLPQRHEPQRLSTWP